MGKIFDMVQAIPPHPLPRLYVMVSILPEFSCKMGKLPLNVNNDTVKSSIQELLAEF